MIGFLIYMFVALFIVAWLKDQWREKPVRPLPWTPRPVPTPSDDSGQPLSMRVPTDQLDRCLAQVNRLAKASLPRWPYQAALTFFEPQLAALRGEFDRLLATPVDQATVATLNAYGHYSDYLNYRIRSMERTLAEMRALFSANLPAACDAQDPDKIREAVNAIIRDCRWIYAWGLDQQHYRGPCASELDRSLGPREAEHIFRQVETLVADLKRRLADPAPKGSLLFRAEFYFPKKEEVDRPVLAVIGAP